MVMAATIVTMVLAGCDGGKRAELERKNGELRADKARLEQEVASLRAEKDKLEAPSPINAGAEPGDDPRLFAAQDAYVHGNYVDAIKLAEKAVGSAPDKAWRIVGAANCFLKNVGGAKSAYGHLDEPQRAFLRYVCQRNGVKLD